MRNTEKRSTRPSAPSPSPSTANGTRGTSSAGSPLGSTAFSGPFLHRSAERQDVHLEGPAIACGLVEDSFWHGPWDVEPIVMEHGKVWAVVRRGEPVEAGRAVAVTRLRSDALLIAAVLPGLAVPGQLTLGEKVKKLGVPIHEGARCIGHLARLEPAIVDHLHVARTLVGRPESFALAVDALGREEVPVLGRALMRRMAEAGNR